MAAFNELILLLTCRCGLVGERIVQFRYGRVWQLVYTVGSAVEWGEGAVGSSSDQLAAVQGWLTACNRCSHEGDVAVLAKDGVLVGVTSWEGVEHFADYGIRVYPDD